MRIRNVLALCLSLAMTAATAHGQSVPASVTVAPTVADPYVYAVQLSCEFHQDFESDGMSVTLETQTVLERQLEASPEKRAEAFYDAQAYNGSDIIGRFEVAAGTSLSASDAPITAYTLEKLVNTASEVAGCFKKQYPRLRPFAASLNPPKDFTTSITPCDTDYLSEQGSNPSGHSMNGYAVASVLSQVLPKRREPLMARGIAYGENRVICGVHYPSDVLAGRKVAVRFLEALRPNPELQRDIRCSVEEEAHKLDAHYPSGLSPECRAVYAAAQSALHPTPVNKAAVLLVRKASSLW
jgi:hypothetical protein